MNRALVSYYFGGKSGLLDALVDTLFQNAEFGSADEVRAGREGPELAVAVLDWHRDIAATDRVNQMLYELLPHALRDPEMRARFAEEYRAYRQVDSAALAGAPRELSKSELQALAMVCVAMLEGLAMLRALDPGGFDFEATWRMWRVIVGEYLRLPD